MTTDNVAQSPRQPHAYVLRAAGTYPNRHWIGEGYDAEETYVDAAFRTARKVKGMKMVAMMVSTFITAFIRLLRLER